MIRVRADLAEMISEICRLQDTSSAMLIDPLLRPQITVRYERLRPHIEAIRDAQAKAAEAEASAAQKQQQPGTPTAEAEGKPAGKKKKP